MLTAVTSFPLRRRRAARSLQSSIRKCAKHLGHALDLAAIAERSDPERAARYIADTLRDLSPHIARVLTAAAVK